MNNQLICEKQVSFGTLSAWKDHELSPENEQTLSSHISNCASCHQRLQGMDTTGHLLQSLKELEPGSRIWDGVRLRVNNPQNKLALVKTTKPLGVERTNDMNRKQWLAALASSVAAIMVITLFAVMLHVYTGKPSNTSRATATATATMAATATAAPTVNPSQTPIISGQSFAAQEIPIASSSESMGTIQSYSPSQVYAFGYDGLNGTPLMYQWNGAKWTNEPAVSNMQAIYVSEINPNDIWELTTLTFNEPRPYDLIHWNGSKWTQMNFGDNGAGSYGPFTAFSDTNILFLFNMKGTGGELQRFNGSGVTPVSIPASVFNLTDMAAISSTNVWISGTSADKNFNPAGALILNWNGTKVTAYSNPLQNDTTANLAGISGDSANDVWAVGNNTAGAVIERWNGAVWGSITPSFNTADVQLNSVKAFSANDIWVGGSQGGQPFAAIYNGAVWTQEPIAVAGTSGAIDSISGTGANDVWFSGSQKTGIGTQQGWLDHWNGSAFTSYLFMGSTQAGGESLQAITAISPTDVWAIDPNGTFLAHNANGVITTIPIQLSITQTNALVGYSDTDLWIFGENNQQKLLIFHWNGSQFSAVQIPAAITPDTFLGVAAIGTDSFYLMYEHSANNVINVITLLKYTGSAWVTESPAFLQDQCSFLPPATDKNGAVYISEQCNTSGGNYTTGTIWYSGDGNTWNKIQGFDAIIKNLPESDPKGGVRYPSLANIMPFGASDIDLVLQGYAHVYVIHWNGTIWSLLPQPESQSSSFVNPVVAAASSAQDIWLYITNYNTPFIAHWDGAKWTDYSPANQYDQFYQLADSQGTPWLTGSSGADNNPVFETLKAGA